MTAKLPEQLRQDFLHSIPLGRFGTCEEVAEMIVFLAGEKAGYITGQVFNINGGLYMTRLGVSATKPIDWWFRRRTKWSSPAPACRSLASKKVSRRSATAGW